MRRWVGAALLAAVLCGGAGMAAGGSGPHTFVYVHDRGSTDQVFGFSLAADGSLAPLGGSPFGSDAAGAASCGGYCQTMAYSKRKKLLYTSSDDGIIAWSVAADGSLAEDPGSLTGSDKYFGVAVAERGPHTFVYAVNFSNGAVDGFESLDADPLSPLAASPKTGSSPVGIASSKNLLFVRNQGDASVSLFAVGKDGSLTEAPDSPFGSTSGWYVDVDPTGRRVYLPDSSTGSIGGSTVDRRTPALLPIPLSPFATDLSNGSGGAAFAKKFVIALGAYGEGNAQAFRAAKDGSLTKAADPVDMLVGGTGAYAHAVAPGGRILLVANSGAVQALLLDPKTGALVPGGSGAVIPAESVNSLVVVRR